MRKEKVFQALWWLKQHNKEYESITICEQNLDSLDGDIVSLVSEVDDVLDDQDTCEEPNFNDMLNLLESMAMFLLTAFAMFLSQRTKILQMYFKIYLKQATTTPLWISPMYAKML